MKELQPINQHVLVDITTENKEYKTASGLIIPDSAREKQAMGKVVGVAKIENAEVQVGDTVIYKKFAGTETEFEGRKYLILPYADVLAKVVETESI